MQENLALIQIIFSISVAFLSIVTFFYTRKKENMASGNKTGELYSELRHINAVLSDVRVEINEINHKMDTNSERITRVEESVRQAHKRLNTLENKIERMEEK